MSEQLGSEKPKRSGYGFIRGPLPDKPELTADEKNSPDPLRGVPPRVLGIIYSTCDEAGTSFDQAREPGLNKQSGLARSVVFTLLSYIARTEPNPKYPLTREVIGKLFNRTPVDVKKARARVHDAWRDDPDNLACELLRAVCQRLGLDPVLVMRGGSESAGKAAGE